MSTDTKKIIYSMVRVGKRQGVKQVLRDISLSYFYGAKIGVLGLNGAGKSSLLRIMAGIDRDYLGEAHLAEGISVGYLPQEPELDPQLSVRENVRQGAGEVNQLLSEFDAINARFAEEMSPEEMEQLIARQAEVQDRLDRCDAWSLDDRLSYAMEALSCPPADSPVTHLSGGETRRVALCRLLIQEPDILLLDEPTNHLDAASVAWLEQHLAAYKGTVIAVTHDRYFLDNVAGWILELDRGHGIPYQGNYSGWLEQKQKRLAQESKQEDRRARQLERELEWVRMSPKARQAKNKARMQAYHKLLEQSTEQLSRELKLLIPPGPRLGSRVIEAKGISKSFGGRTLYQDLSFVLPPGGIVGVIGPNGVGKTTLFRMITGDETPDCGQIILGETVRLGYMQQSRQALDPDKTLFEVISEGRDTIEIGGRDVAARSYVAQFNFTGQDQEKKVSALSGGERNRVQLALLIKSHANVILLDEPSNDLDVNTLRALEDALNVFAGCAVVISHDRWFLDRVATHILSFAPDGKVTWFEGNYSEFCERHPGVHDESGGGGRRYKGIRR